MVLKFGKFQVSVKLALSHVSFAVSYQGSASVEPFVSWVILTPERALPVYMGFGSGNVDNRVTSELAVHNGKLKLSHRSN